MSGGLSGGRRPSRSRSRSRSARSSRGFRPSSSSRCARRRASEARSRPRSSARSTRRSSTARRAGSGPPRSRRWPTRDSSFSRAGRGSCATPLEATPPAPADPELTAVAFAFYVLSAAVLAGAGKSAPPGAPRALRESSRDERRPGRDGRRPRLFDGDLRGRGLVRRGWPAAPRRIGPAHVARKRRRRGARPGRRGRPRARLCRARPPALPLPYALRDVARDPRGGRRPRPRFHVPLEADGARPRARGGRAPRVAAFVVPAGNAYFRQRESRASVAPPLGPS